jgi:signal transduction histidine kinase
MFGISRHEAVGRPIGELLPVALADELGGVGEDESIHNIYKFRLTPADFPEEFRSEPSSPTNGAGKEERERVLNVVVAPLVAKNFDRIGRLIIFDDVTDRIELEEQLVQADKLSSIGLLAAGVAHEVNTPLAVISSYAQMLARQVSGEPGQAKILDKITSQTFRASEIVNSLLSFSRTSPRRLERVELTKAIRDTLDLVEPQLRHAKIEVEAEFDPAAARVTGNAGKLQQVFLNLFLNARDAMPEGGRLRVRTQVSPDGPAARVTVSDSGVGMSAEQTRQVFDPFFTTKGPQRGTGLGLAVCYGIIQEHSGTITVESSPGEGSSFHIEIPLERKPVHA